MTSNSAECSVEGCDRKREARGLCKMHWSRWRKHGSPLVEKSPKPLPHVCEADGCESKPHTRWRGGPAYCNKHYLRMLENGSLDLQGHRKPSPKGTCHIDGCDNPSRSVGENLCEKHYGRRRRSGTYETDKDMSWYAQCVYCERETNGLKYCNSRCQARYDRGNPRYRECPVCLNWYEPCSTHGRDRMVCSDECDWIRTKARYDARRPVNGLFEEGFALRLEVFQRDSWVCQICGEETDRSAVWPDPKYPTIDHIIPVAHGGDHTEENLQCACRECNSKKGASLPLGQQPLTLAHMA